MKVITIDEQAYRTLVRKIDRVYDYIREQAERENNPPPDPGEVWIGNDEAADLLAVSARTLQRLRSGGEITYSIRGGRVWYTLADVQGLIAGRVIRSKYSHEAELLEAHLAYHERRGKKNNNTKK